MPALQHSFKTLRREWRSGELRLIAAALIVAVAAVTAVTLFTDRVRQAMVLRANGDLPAAGALTQFGQMTHRLSRALSAHTSWETFRSRRYHVRNHRKSQEARSRLRRIESAIQMARRRLRLDGLLKRREAEAKLVESTIAFLGYPGIPY